jgi:hypothetical protein
MFPAATHTQIAAGIGANTLENNLFVFEDAICNLGDFQGATQKTARDQSTSSACLPQRGLGQGAISRSSCSSNACGR